MTPISLEEALQHTDPNLPDEQRQASAQRIQEGVAANEAYWDSRTPLERYEAQAAGHGVVQRGDAAPEAVATADEPRAIDSTAVEEPAATSGSEAPTQVPPSPDNPVEAVSRLRAQLEAAGIPPEA